jgi:hypothetical protein
LALNLVNNHQTFQWRQSLLWSFQSAAIHRFFQVKERDLVLLGCHNPCQCGFSTLPGTGETNSLVCRKGSLNGMDGINSGDHPCRLFLENRNVNIRFSIIDRFLKNIQFVWEIV